jgi:alpha-amylase/alpha-mannosidase (GH57 family)
MDKFICIHGHFYQPPRENPWLEEVELQDSAYPYHDWNERITAECYAPNAASRILGPDGKIIDIVNNYARINFNFGPTLLSWLERHQPEAYQAILEADRLSIARFSGHGSAMAQVYNHMIMPLAPKRDKTTQVLWGIRDFERRFRRFPEGLWLPETAVDLETLEVLAELGIRFTVLAPHQVRRVKAISEEKWEEVEGEGVDPTMAYLCPLPSGKSIHIFVYDGPISHDVAFGGLLGNGETFASRLRGAFRKDRPGPQLVHIATDGETYGHHQRYGDMALSYCLYSIESDRTTGLTNYGAYLEKHPPTHLIEIAENTSWSCAHGIERWRNHCGCHSGAHPEWTQAWRKPLRDAMDWLRDRVLAIYEKNTAGYLRDPWQARDEYIEVISNRSRTDVGNFLRRHEAKPLSQNDLSRMLKLLETQRHSMLMYTSCGWFFDDVSGIETIQVMQYAARVIQLAEEIENISLEPEFMKFLQEAPGNLHENGADVYERFVTQSRVDLLRAGAHHAMMSLFDSCPDCVKIYCYTIYNEGNEQLTAGKLKLVMGKSRVVSDVTWEERHLSFAVLHLGDHHINGGVCLFPGEGSFSILQEKIRSAFEKGDVPEVILLLTKHFGKHNYSVSDLFKDEQRTVLNQILQLTYKEIAAAFGQIHENHYALMNFFQSLHIPIPRPLLLAMDFVTNADIQDILLQEEIDLLRLDILIREARRWSARLDTANIAFLAGLKIEALLNRSSMNPENIGILDSANKFLESLTPLQIELNLWKPQNLYFAIGKRVYLKMNEQANQGDASAKKWVEAFLMLGQYLHVKAS